MWADENLTLRPHDHRSYSLDLLNLNNSLIYVKLEKVTKPILLKIVKRDSNKTLIEQHIRSIKPPETPFKFFWTPPYNSASWDFVFDNPYDRTTKVTVKIIDYRYNVEWQQKVTRYGPPLDRSSVYVGISVIIMAIAPVAHDLYRERP